MEDKMFGLLAILFLVAAPLILFFIIKTLEDEKSKNIYTLVLSIIFALPILLQSYIDKGVRFQHKDAVIIYMTMFIFYILYSLGVVQLGRIWEKFKKK